MIALPGALLKAWVERSIRTCSATSIAIDDPRHVRIASRLPGHRAFSTTEKYYNQARGVEATQLVHCGAATMPSIEPSTERIASEISAVAVLREHLCEGGRAFHLRADTIDSAVEAMSACRPVSLAQQTHWESADQTGRVPENEPALAGGCARHRQCVFGGDGERENVKA
jgi:hypothetical protein